MHKQRDRASWQKLLNEIVLIEANVSIRRVLVRGLEPRPHYERRDLINSLASGFDFVILRLESSHVERHRTFGTYCKKY